MEAIIGSVGAFTDVNTSGKRKSFHVIIKVKTAVAKSPGLIRGRIMRANVPKSEHPSIWAESISSLDIPSKKPLSNQIIKGKFKDVLNRMIIRFVSFNPILVEIRNIGIIRETGGIILSPIMERSRGVFPRKRYFEKP